MAKISPVLIKYMIHASFNAEGALEKPDVIGAIFGQTEGLLGADLEMRELQKEGKIGRIEVDLERKDKRTTGKIKIPTALDQSETTLIAAAIETIERIGPCDSTIEIERIEDVRGSKRDYILTRAKKLMQEIEGTTDSRIISKEIKDATRMAEINSYGDENLPSGDMSGPEIIVVEGRADVLNLLKNGVKNVIGMNGTKLPEAIKKLSQEKDLILFVDGDRGGKLICQNVIENAKVKAIAVAPDGKEVEELTNKEIHQCLRKTVSIEEFKSTSSLSSFSLSTPQTNILKSYFEKNLNSSKFLLLDSSLNLIKSVSTRLLFSSLEKEGTNKVFALVYDGLITSKTLEILEDFGVKVVVAKNFASTSLKTKLISF